MAFSAETFRHQRPFYDVRHHHLPGLKINILILPGLRFGMVTIC